MPRVLHRSCIALFLKSQDCLCQIAPATRKPQAVTSNAVRGFAAEDMAVSSWTWDLTPEENPPSLCCLTLQLAGRRQRMPRWGAVDAGVVVAAVPAV
jgi:hypothetical protein